MRADLLALTEEDLAELTTRGAVKRGLRELDGDPPPVVVEEAQDGTVTVTGSEDATVARLAPGVAVEEAECTCDAIGCCRHVARAVLAYQRTTTAEAPAAAAWDPGAFTDAELAAVIPPAARRQAAAAIAAGAAVTVIRSAKPMAILHDVGLAVRFLVPDELAYARCACARSPRCEHVAVAVAAFRAVPGATGVVVLGVSAAVPAAATAAVAAALALLGEAGVGGGRAAVQNAFGHAERRCRAAGLPWVADVMAELADLCARHGRADSTFTPLRAAQLVGEAVLRCDALRGSAVPRLFAGGPREPAETVVGAGRLIGLGTRVRAVGARTDVDAIVYDTATHGVLSLGRAHVARDGAAPDFAVLADGAVQRGISIAGVGRGQLLATGGRRTAAGGVALGRRPAALSAQRFLWDELLRAPVLAEGAAELRGLAAAAFPAALAPRTAGGGSVVVPLAGVTAAGFHTATSTVLAHLTDPAGDPLVLAHPFSTRSAGGSERLLARLERVARGDGTARYVAGRAWTSGAETVIEPIGVVVEDASGHRELLQPWIDPAPSTGSTIVAAADDDAAPAGPLAVAQAIEELQRAIGTLLVAGVARADRRLREDWTALAARLEGLGSTTLAAATARVAAALDARRHDPRWAPGAAVAAVVALAPLAELARAL